MVLEREKYRSKLTCFASQYQSKSSTCLEFFCVLSIKIESEAVVTRDTTEAAAVVTVDNLASGQAAKGRGEEAWEDWDPPCQQGAAWRIKKVARTPGS